MNTCQKGDLCVINTLKFLIENNYKVSVPFQEDCRYDLIADINNQLFKIQCKKGVLADGVIKANLISSHYHRGKTNRPYSTSEVDYFVICHFEEEQLYLVKNKENILSSFYLRIEPTRNNQKTNVNWAKDYKIEKFW